MFIFCVLLLRYLLDSLVHISNYPAEVRCEFAAGKDNSGSHASIDGLAEGEIIQGGVREAGGERWEGLCGRRHSEY